MSERADEYAPWRCDCGHLDIYHVLKTGVCWAGDHTVKCDCTRFRQEPTHD